MGLPAVNECLCVLSPQSGDTEDFILEMKQHLTTYFPTDLTFASSDISQPSIDRMFSSPEHSSTQTDPESNADSPLHYGQRQCDTVEDLSLPEPSLQLDASQPGTGEEEASTPSTVNDETGQICGESHSLNVECGHSEGSNSLDAECGHSEGSNSLDVECGHSEGSNSLDAECGHSEGSNSLDAECGHLEGSNSLDAECGHSEGSNLLEVEYGHLEASNSLDAECGHSEELNSLDAECGHSQASKSLECSGECNENNFSESLIEKPASSVVSGK